MAGEDPLRVLYSNKTTITFSNGTSTVIDGSAFISGLLTDSLEENVTKLGCYSTNIINMTSYLPIGKTNYPDYAGIYDSVDLELKKDTYVNKNRNVPEDSILKALTSTTEAFKTRWLTNSVAIKNSLDMCPGKTYFYIPLILRLIEEITTLSHANGILINREKNTVMRIEPKFNPMYNAALNEKIKEGILTFVQDELELKDPIWVEVNEICPQSLIKDKNCGFWTLMLYKLFLENLDKDPNSIIKEISSRPDLPALVESFKNDLKTKIIPEGLARANIKWEAFETLQKGGKNGRRKSKFKTTRRKHGKHSRKTKANRK